MAAKPARGRQDAALARAAGTAHALAATSDRDLLVATAGVASCEAVGGAEWRFLAVDPLTGALTDPARGAGERAVLPEPGGVLERLLVREEPVVARRGRAGDPTPDTRLWREPRRLVLGWPVASGGVVHGLLLVAMDGARDPEPSALAEARLYCDQLGLALERELLREACASQAAAMVGLEQRANAGEAHFSELISVVAHEIRTPLTAIKAYTEALIDAPSDEFEQRKKFLGVIDEECDRLGRLVGDALDLSRLEAGHRSLKLRPLDPAEFLAELASTVEPEARRRGLTLTLDVQPSGEGGSTPVEGDSDLLKQLMLNLIGNAIKFSPDGGRITVRSRCEGPEWRLAVEDEGSGIPEDQLDRIFERFYRVELRGGRRVPGTGLGLAIARHIAELHDGAVWASNGNPGGSVFSVRLPRLQRAPASTRGVAGALVRRGDVRALLEESVDMVSELMRAQIVSILWVDPDEGDLVVRAATGLDEVARTRRIPYRAGVAGAALRAGCALLVDNIETDRRFSKKSHPQYFTKSLLAAPVIVAGEAVGVLNVNNKETHEEFVEADRGELTALVARLSAALTRAFAYPEATSVVAEARQAVRAATRAHRESLLDRTELARRAGEVAARLGLGGPESARLERMVSGAAGPAPADDVEARRVLLHARAERFDGTGLPLGLAGDAIPLGARILAALGRFEELTRGRPYRAGATLEQALATLRAEGGHAFDPRVVDALCEALERAVARRADRAPDRAPDRPKEAA